MSVNKTIISTLLIFFVLLQTATAQKAYLRGGINFANVTYLR